MATKYVNGVPVVMTPAEEAAFEAERTPTLGQAKRDARRRVRNRQLQARANGFLYQAQRIDSDNDTLTDILVFEARGRRAKEDNETWANPVRFQAADGSNINLSRQETLDLAKAAGDHLMVVNERARTLIQAINQAADNAAVAAAINDIDNGWPA